MLINALLEIIYLFFSGLMGAIQLVQLPASTAQLFADFLHWISTGVAFCNSFIHPVYIYSLLSFLLLFNAAVNGYHFIMWILKKLPFFNIQ